MFWVFVGGVGGRGVVFFVVGGSSRCCWGFLLVGLGLCLGTLMRGGLLGRVDVECGAIVIRFA